MWKRTVSENMTSWHTYTKYKCALETFCRGDFWIYIYVCIYTCIGIARRRAPSLSWAWLSRGSGFRYISTYREKYLGMCVINDKERYTYIWSEKSWITCRPVLFFRHAPSQSWVWSNRGSGFPARLRCRRRTNGWWRGWVQKRSWRMRGKTCKPRY